MTLALEVKNLEKTYASGTKALAGVSLEVGQGDFFALLGPNGAGKTTLIGIATGIVTPTAGSLAIAGIDAFDEPSAARRKVGVVPQNLNIDWFAKCIDTVVNQGGYYGIPRAVAVPRAKQILTDLGLGDKLYATGRELSGGMQRRLMIARALINEPELLFLDEPTAGVDVESRRSMWKYVRALNEKGVTILLTTHYLEEAEQLAKHVAVINKGKIAAAGTLEDIFARANERRRASDGLPAGEAGFRGGKLEEAYLALTGTAAEHTES